LKKDVFKDVFEEKRFFLGFYMDRLTHLYYRPYQTSVSRSVHWRCPSDARAEQWAAAILCLWPRRPVRLSTSFCNHCYTRVYAKEWAHRPPRYPARK